MKAGLDTFAKKLEYFKKMNKLDDNDISTYQAVFDKADDDSSGDDDDGHGAQDIELQERATLLGGGVANKRRADQLRRGSLKNKLAKRWTADARCAHAGLLSLIVVPSGCPCTALYAHFHYRSSGC